MDTRWSSPTRTGPEAMRREFGWEATPLREAVAEYLEWLAEEEAAGEGSGEGTEGEAGGNGPPRA